MQTGLVTRRRAGVSVAGPRGGFYEAAPAKEGKDITPISLTGVLLPRPCLAVVFCRRAARRRPLRRNRATPCFVKRGHSVGGGVPSHFRFFKYGLSVFASDHRLIVQQIAFSSGKHHGQGFKSRRHVGGKLEWAGLIGGCDPRFAYKQRRISSVANCLVGERAHDYVLLRPVLDLIRNESEHLCSAKQEHHRFVISIALEDAPDHRKPIATQSFDVVIGSTHWSVKVRIKQRLGPFQVARTGSHVLVLDRKSRTVCE